VHGTPPWWDGWLDFELAEGRRAAPLCDQLRRAAERSRSRGRIAMVVLDNLGIHTPKGSRLLRALLADAQVWARSITPAEVLGQIGSPFALHHRPVIAEEPNHAA
jgi:hypothetical protein